MVDAAWNVFKESRKSARRARRRRKGRHGKRRNFAWIHLEEEAEDVTRVRVYLERGGLNTLRISSRWKSTLVWFHFNAFSKHVAFFASYWWIRGSVVMLGRIPSVSRENPISTKFWRATSQTRKVLWVYSRRFAEALMSLGKRRERKRERRIGVGKNVWAN